jgi:hypothetical protein
MSISPDAKASVAKELHRLEEDSAHSGKAQYNAGDRWRVYQYWLGIPSTVLSVAAGLAFFKNDPILGATSSMAAAILTGLMTFLKPSERAAAHKSSGDQYLSLRNDSRVFREIKLIHVRDDQAAIDGLSELTKRRNELNASSLSVSRHDFERARKGIDKGEATHRVDRRAAQ